MCEYRAGTRIGLLGGVGVGMFKAAGRSRMLGQRERKARLPFGPNSAKTGGIGGTIGVGFSVPKCMGFLYDIALRWPKCVYFPKVVN